METAVIEAGDDLVGDEDNGDELECDRRPFPARPYALAGQIRIEPQKREDEYCCEDHKIDPVRGDRDGAGRSEQCHSSKEEVRHRLNEGRNRHGGPRV
jgi:hypothetical protein